MGTLSAEQEQRLRALIAKHQLGAAENRLLAQAMECCPLRLGRPEDYTRIGNSRYAGVPDLPPFLPWPRSENRFLNFLMQVNLGDLPALVDNPLPNQGMLYFFIEGDEACTDVMCCVLFYEGDLVHEHYRDLVAHEILVASGIDLPGYGSDLFRQIEERAEPTE